MSNFGHRNKQHTNPGYNGSHLTGQGNPPLTYPITLHQPTFFPQTLNAPYNAIPKKDSRTDARYQGPQQVYSQQIYPYGYQTPQAQHTQMTIPFTECKPREKKILTICDPSTGKPVTLTEESDQKNKGEVVRREFASKISEGVEMQDVVKKNLSLEPEKSNGDLKAELIAKVEKELHDDSGRGNLTDQLEKNVIDDPVLDQEAISTKILESTPSTEPEAAPPALVDEDVADGASVSPKQIIMPESLTIEEKGMPASQQSTPNESEKLGEIVSSLQIKSRSNSETSEKAALCPSENEELSAKSVKTNCEEKSDSEDTVQEPSTENEALEESSSAAAALSANVMTSSTIDETVIEEDEAIKSEADRAAEEAEKKKLREQELVKELTDILETDKRIADLVYSRDFLTVVGSIERELSWTPCPLSDEKLKALGIDKSSAPQREASKSNFLPSWARGKERKVYVPRPSKDGARPITRRPVPTRHSTERTIERLPPLPRAANAWKPEKLDGLSEEEKRIKTTLKNVRSLMNKITPTTQAELTEELLGMKVWNNEKTTLCEIVSIIFDKAVEEPKFCPLYSEVCLAQVDAEIAINRGNISKFRDAILQNAQTTFSSEKTEDEQRNQKLLQIEAEADEHAKARMQLELKEKDARFRRRKFGNITFIGQLYMQGILSLKIINSCLMRLLKVNTEEKKFNPEVEEAIDCAVRLLETCGHRLEVDGLRLSDIWFNNIFDHLDKLITPRCSNRIRFMIWNLLELRASKWQKLRTVDQGPKRLEEIHKEIQQEQMNNQEARNRYEREQGLKPSGFGGSGGVKKMAPTQRGSYGTNKGSSMDRRKQAASSSALSGSSAPPKKNMSMTMADTTKSFGNKSGCWVKGASGGEESSRKANALYSYGRSSLNREIKTSSMDDERAKALASVRNVTQGTLAAGTISSRNSIEHASRDDSPALNRSESQTSMVSQSSEPPTCDETERKVARSLRSTILEVCENATPTEEICQEFFVDLPKKHGVNVRSLFKSFALAVVEEIADKALPTAGNVLAILLESEELKKGKIGRREDALAGLSDFCIYAIDVELRTDAPKIWEKLATFIVFAVQGELDTFEGARPSLNDFSTVFLEAAKDSGKPYELLTIVLTMVADMNYKRDPSQHETMTSMAFLEIRALDKLSADEKARMHEAFKKIEIPGIGNLDAIVTSP